MRYIKLFEDIDFDDMDWEEYEPYTTLEYDNPFTNSSLKHEENYLNLKQLIGKQVRFKVDWWSKYVEGILQDVKKNKIGEFELKVDNRFYLLDEREKIQYIKENITEEWYKDNPNFFLSNIKDRAIFKRSTHKPNFIKRFEINNVINKLKNISDEDIYFIERKGTRVSRR